MMALYRSPEDPDLYAQKNKDDKYFQSKLLVIK